MVKTKVTYLEVQITHESRRLSSDQVQGILELPSPTTRKQLQAFLGLTGYCRIWIPNYGLIAPTFIWKLKGTRWFNPTDVGNSSKEGRGYTKPGLNSGTCLEVDRPRKSISTLCPWKRGNSLGSVNSKVGVWAPACSLLIQEAWSNYPRGRPCLRNLAAIAIMIEDALKLSFGGKLNYLYQPPSKTTPKWERPFMDVWSKNPQISSNADGKSRPHYIPLWGS